MGFKMTIVVILAAVFLIEGGCAESPTPPAKTPPAKTPPNIKGAPTATSSANPDALISPDIYPYVRRNETVEDRYANRNNYTLVKDPYRWLEDPESTETKEFIKKEMNITTPYLEKSLFRAQLTARLKEIQNYPKYLGLQQEGDKFFSFQNTGLQDQDVIYIHDSINDTGRIFFDPNKLSNDGSITLGDNEFSDDGQVFAYGTSEKGSQWETLQFMSVEKGGDFYKEKLTKVKITNIAFTKDGKGVFYSCFPDYKGKGSGDENEQIKNQKLFYHVLGTDQSKDVIVADYPQNPNYIIFGSVSDDGKYLIVYVSEGSQNQIVYVADLEVIRYEIKGKLKLVPVVTVMEANYDYITNNGTKFVFMTNKDADNYRLVTIDIANPKPDPNSWTDLVPEDKNNTLLDAYAAWNNYLILSYIVDVKSVVQLHDLTNGKMLKKFDLDSFFTPGIVYHCDLSKPSPEVEIFKEIQVKNFDRKKYTIEQVFYKSKDGTKIPMYILYKTGLQKNGNNFSFLTAYGAFGDSELPAFDIHNLIIVDNFNGIYALCNIRGGGEYGEKWHKAGSLHNRQNSFDDFQAGAEFLINKNYTSVKLLAINGGSAGGTLVAVCLNQRPNLFGAVVADVGVMDMLRFELFSGGMFRIPEYGSPTNATDFPYLYAYSPLHNVNITNCRTYPATMLTTSDHDDRVPPLHSLKLIATLQFQAKKAPNQKKPLIIRVKSDAGHFGAITVDKSIAAFVDTYDEFHCT